MGNEVRPLYLNKKYFLSKTVMLLYILSLLVSEFLNSKTNISYIGEHTSVVVDFFFFMGKFS